MVDRLVPLVAIAESVVVVHAEPFQYFHVVRPSNETRPTRVVPDGVVLVKVTEVMLAELKAAKEKLDPVEVVA
jgi:hypothetical protein